MGLGILPARLKTEFELIGSYLLGEESIAQDERVKKHWHWVLKIKDKYQAHTDVNSFILEEAGKVFSQVLKDAGVFKMDEVGKSAFKEFLLLL